jgi:LmbE family N-acetylglucosaminyl deacetylase
VNVTALLAHPDDELMCAGTLARFGGTVVTLFVDDRWSEWKVACAALGCETLALREDEDDFAWTRRTVSSLEPLMPATDLWITHRADDANTSHAHIGRLARTLARKNHASVWEIDQSLPGGIAPGTPNLYVDITDQTDAKHHAIQSYPSQLHRYPGMAEAIEHRDRLYGWQIGVVAAEGFTVHKAIL